MPTSQVSSQLENSEAQGLREMYKYDLKSTAKWK